LIWPSGRDLLYTYAKCQDNTTVGSPEIQKFAGIPYGKKAKGVPDERLG